MTAVRKILFLLVGVGLCGLVVLAFVYYFPEQRSISEQQLSQTGDGQVAHGQYIFRLTGCAHCHTADDGPALAGGRAFETDFGTFYSPNITPDPEHGIGSWTANDFVQALSHGVGPDKQRYFPVFPYTSYTAMTTEDMLALYAYMKTLTPVAKANLPHQKPWYLNSIAMLGWRYRYFTPGTYNNDSEQSQPWNRGAYIAQALAHCRECHTPRNQYGALRQELAFSGADYGPDGNAPNISAHSDGIGDWQDWEIEEFLAEGILPDGDYTGSVMADIIDDGTSHLSQEDLEALTQYLLDSSD